MTKLSIVIPVYNERDTIRDVLTAVSASDTCGLEKEIIVVDDGSRDGTREFLRSLEPEPGRTILYHEANRGKGAALRTGFARASGDIILVQDADLEYDPGDYRRLIEPILNGGAEVVFGSRNLGSNNIPFSAVYFYGGLLSTKIFNFLFGTKFTDIHTGYKLFPKKFVPELLRLAGNDFVYDAVELTHALAERGRIIEVPISYRARRRGQGKKLSWRDGVKCVWAMMKIASDFSRAALGRSLRVALWLLGFTFWIGGGILALNFVPIPAFSLEAVLKGPIFLYYFTVFFGWIEFLRRNGVLPFLLAGIGLGVIYFSTVESNGFSRRFRFFRFLLPGLHIFVSAAILLTAVRTGPLLGLGLLFIVLFFWLLRARSGRRLLPA